jgi:hypothetical protein
MPVEAGPERDSMTSSPHKAGTAEDLADSPDSLPSRQQVETALRTLIDAVVPQGAPRPERRTRRRKARGDS